MEVKAWLTISNLIALLVLIGAFVLVLVGKIDLIAALLIGGLAVAELLD